MRNNSPRHVISGLVALAALVALTSCSATRLTDVWRDPGYAGGPFRQVAVFVLGADEAVRKLVEDEIVRRLPMSTRGVGGYGIVPEAERGDIDKARDRLRAGGFDGAMIARVVGVEGPVPWAAGSLQQVPVSYRTLGNYYVNTYQETERAGRPPRFHGRARPAERVRGRLRGARLVGGHPDVQSRGNAGRGRGHGEGRGRGAPEGRHPGGGVRGEM